MIDWKFWFRFMGFYLGFWGILFIAMLLDFGEFPPFTGIWIVISAGIFVASFASWRHK